MNPLLQLALVVVTYFVARSVVKVVRNRRMAEPIAAMAGLRQMALSRGASDVSAPPIAGVFGVLMELGLARGVATIVGMVDGNASLYLSTGGGVLGGAGHEPVRQAASGLCLAAATALDHLTPTTAFPMPSSGHVRFFATTEAGVRTAESEEALLRMPDHPLHSLYVAGQELLTALRVSTQQPAPDGA